MERRDFIHKISAGAAIALVVTGIGSCLSPSEDPQATPVDFILNLNLLPQLTKSGGFLIKENVLVAKTTQGDYIAATLICSHEQERKVMYDEANNQFHCTAHDARFDASGKGLNNNGKRNLTTYITELNGTSLHVFSK